MSATISAATATATCSAAGYEPTLREAVSSLLGWYAVVLNVLNLGFAIGFKWRDQSTGDVDRAATITWTLQAATAFASQLFNLADALPTQFLLFVWNLGANLTLTFFDEILNQDSKIGKRLECLNNIPCWNNKRERGIKKNFIYRKVQEARVEKAQRDALDTSEYANTLSGTEKRNKFRRRRDRGDKKLRSWIKYGNWLDDVTKLKGRSDIWFKSTFVILGFLLITFVWALLALTKPNKYTYNCVNDPEVTFALVGGSWHIIASYICSIISFLCVFIGRRGEFFDFWNRIQNRVKGKPKTMNHVQYAQKLGTHTGSCVDNGFSIGSILTSSTDGAFLRFQMWNMLAGGWSSTADLLLLSGAWKTTKLVDPLLIRPFLREEETLETLEARREDKQNEKNRQQGRMAGRRSGNHSTSSSGESFDRDTDPLDLELTDYDEDDAKFLSQSQVPRAYSYRKVRPSPHPSKLEGNYRGASGSSRNGRRGTDTGNHPDKRGRESKGFSLQGERKMRARDTSATSTTEPTSGDPLMSRMHYPSVSRPGAHPIQKASKPPQQSKFAARNRPSHERSSESRTLMNSDNDEEESYSEGSDRTSDSEERRMEEGRSYPPSPDDDRARSPTARVSRKGNQGDR